MMKVQWWLQNEPKDPIGFTDKIIESYNDGFKVQRSKVATDGHHVPFLIKIRSMRHTPLEETAL
jgi:hypothetical protein